MTLTYVLYYYWSTVNGIATFTAMARPLAVELLCLVDDKEPYRDKQRPSCMRWATHYLVRYRTLATPSVHCLVMGGVLRLLLLTESKLILLIAVGALAVLPTGLLGSLDR